MAAAHCRAGFAGVLRTDDETCTVFAGCSARQIEYRFVESKAGAYVSARSHCATDPARPADTLYRRLNRSLAQADPG